MKTRNALIIALLAALAAVLAACSPRGATSNVNSVTINEGDQTLAVGETFKFTATVDVTGTAAKTVTWSSDDTAVAEVAADGTVTAKVEGTATITATSTADKSKSDSVTVTVTAADEPAVNGVTINDSAESVTVAEGATVELTVAVDAVGGADAGVTWRSEDETIATVDENGVVTGVAEGSTTVTATSVFDTSKSDSITVEVTAVGAPVINSVTIDQGDTLSLAEGATSQLTVTVDAEGGADESVTWESSDESVVTVDTTGMVMAVGTAGQSATVTATSTVDPSKSDSIAVTVTASTAKVTLTLDFTGSGSGTVFAGGPDNEATGDATFEFDPDQAITISVFADSGSEFVGFGGACGDVSGTTCQLTMDTDKTVTVALTTAAARTEFNLAIQASSDDAEEYSLSTGGTEVDLGSTDLELPYDPSVSQPEPRGQQTVGLRFSSVSIPKDAVILRAYIEFEPKGADPGEDAQITGDVTLTVSGHANDNSPTFFNSLNNISGRMRTASEVTWSPSTWSTATEATPDLTDVVKDIILRDGWTSGNALTFIIEGDDSTNFRRAYSFDGAGTAPTLVIVYETPTP